MGLVGILVLCSEHIVAERKHTSPWGWMINTQSVNLIPQFTLTKLVCAKTPNFERCIQKKGVVLVHTSVHVESNNQLLCYFITSVADNF